MKAADLDTGEQSERFLIYMHIPGSDDCGIDTAEEGNSTDIASESITKTRLFKYIETFTSKQNKKKIG